jgi:hypothetical protein
MSEVSFGIHRLTKELTCPLIVEPKPNNIDMTKVSLDPI